MLVLCVYEKNHFLNGTTIGGVDCSFMTVESALKNVENFENEDCKLYFTQGTEYEEYDVTLGKIGVHVEKEGFEEILQEQNINRKVDRIYPISRVIEVDKSQLEQQLRQVPQLKEENMHLPEDAKITWNGDEFEIFEEILGNWIDFNEAKDFIFDRLKSGQTEIGLYPITKVQPDVVEQDLWVRKKYLNSIVNSKLYFTLNGGEVVTLDKDIIKTWVIEGPEGYDIDQKNGIAEFVNELSAKVDEANSRIYFTAAHSDKVVSLPVSEELRPKLDMEKQKVEIENMLGGKGSYEVQLYYDRPFLTETEVFSNRIETDKTRQTVWGFENSEEFLESACVTGNVAQGYDTPVGIFYVTEKARNGKMTLYGLSEYKYLIAYDGNYCFHDSSWRYDYGGDIYKTAGSHGCTNMPEEGARILYEHSYLGMLVLIYET